MLGDCERKREKSLRFLDLQATSSLSTAPFDYSSAVSKARARPQAAFCEKLNH